MRALERKNLRSESRLELRFSYIYSLNKNGFLVTYKWKIESLFHQSLNSNFLLYMYVAKVSLKIWPLYQQPRLAATMLVINRGVITIFEKSINIIG